MYIIEKVDRWVTRRQKKNGYFYLNYTFKYISILTPIAKPHRRAPKTRLFPDRHSRPFNIQNIHSSSFAENSDAHPTARFDRYPAGNEKDEKKLFFFYGKESPAPPAGPTNSGSTIPEVSVR